MSSLFHMHGSPGAKRLFLLALGVPGLLIALLAPWMWLNVVGVVILLVMVFFASAFAWEQDGRSDPDR